MIYKHWCFQRAKEIIIIILLVLSTFDTCQKKLKALAADNNIKDFKKYLFK